MGKKQTLIIGVMGLLLIVLAGFILYAYVLNPAISGYATSNYNQGAGDVINVIIGQVQQQGFVQIPVNENQSLVLVPFNPNQVTNPVVEEEISQ